MRKKARIYKIKTSVALLAAAQCLLVPIVAQVDSQPGTTVLARGGGTTIVQGGTGKAGGFIPVLTTIAFHVEQTGTSQSGGFECLARAPVAGSGPGSAQFTVNAMYVTGQITGATINGHSITITGTATITGLGAGSNVPFTLVARDGGPGATGVLTTGGSPQLTFNEILLEGSFKIFSNDENHQ
jgi:hypothetical protein